MAPFYQSKLGTTDSHNRVRLHKSGRSQQILLKLLPDQGRAAANAPCPGGKPHDPDYNWEGILCDYTAFSGWP